MELKKLGIYGCEAIEDLIAASILTGDSAMFIGSAGTGKTFMLERLAEALNLKFIAYNCSSNNFEDLIGFPILNSEKSAMNFIPTPTSIWGVNIVLLDEINRARLDIQNHYFQLIRNRSIQGKKVDSLKWVFAAMNPLSYAGTQPLDKALADRFAWVIRTPAFHVIGEEDRHSIINNITGDDAPAMGHWGFSRPFSRDKALTVELRSYFKAAAAIYNRYLSDCNDVIQYVDDFIISVNNAGGYSGTIEGRRAGILLRNILSLAAVREASGLQGGLEAAAGKAIFHSFINEAVDEPIPNKVLEAAHEKAKGYLRKAASSVMETIERLPYSIQKIAKGMEYNIDPVVLGGYINTHLSEINSDPIAMEAFALAIWPFLKNSNVTNDALASVASIVSTIVSNQDTCFYNSISLGQKIDITSGARELDQAIDLITLKPKQNFTNVANLLSSPAAYERLCEKQGLDFEIEKVSIENANKMLKAYMYVLSHNNSFTPDKFAASQQKEM